MTTVSTGTEDFAPEIWAIDGIAPSFFFEFRTWFLEANERYFHGSLGRNRLHYDVWDVIPHEMASLEFVVEPNVELEVGWFIFNEKIQLQ